jgi:UvrD/REP helicase.
MSKHKLIISSAGSGKTSFLVKKAIENKDQRILITTYTENNEIEIRKKFIAKLGYLPKNVTIQSWFSFLIQHGVKPFQGSLWEPLFNIDIKGLILVNSKSGKWYYDEKIKGRCILEKIGQRIFILQMGISSQINYQSWHLALTQLVKGI